jgi:cellobiose PTS system EIIA component
MDIETVTMQLIAHGGEARSKALEALNLAKTGKIAEARQCLEESSSALEESHKAQAELIESEADGASTPITLLMIHAQDHVMNAITIRELAEQFVDLYERLERDCGNGNPGGTGGEST